MLRLTRLQMKKEREQYVGQVSSLPLAQQDLKTIAAQVSSELMSWNWNLALEVL
jgi:hypothetical protein